MSIKHSLSKLLPDSIGVAFGTLIALLYQIVWMVIYNSKCIIKWPVKNVVKQVFVDLCVVIISYFATCWIQMNEVSYYGWFIMAIKITAIIALIWIGINVIFYKNNFPSIMHYVLARREKVK